MRSRLPELIDPYDEDRVVNCSYELSLGEQVYITGEIAKTRRLLGPREQINIPPGQFAQLLTREVIAIPADSLGLISMKSAMKLRGLVNVSGFHVDPGFKGHLLFSVYNAGPNDIVLSQGTPTFLVWYATLDTGTSDVYKGKRAGLHEISDEDVMRLQGDVYTPHSLAQRLTELERQSLSERVGKLERTVQSRFRRREFIAAIAAAAIGGALAVLGIQAVMSDDEPPTPAPTEEPSDNGQ